jgi:microcystin-dependent protein
MAEPFIGQISVFGFNFAPINWATCQGQIMPISQNTALFSLLGVNFGGNGTSTFGLPNLQGTVAIGQGLALGGSSYDLGETGGATNIALNRQESPTHSHSLMATGVVGSLNSPAGAVLARPFVAGNPEGISGQIYNSNTLDTAMNAPITPIGSGQTHDNLQPYLALTYCICLRGIFPERA